MLLLLLGATLSAQVRPATEDAFDALLRAELGERFDPSLLAQYRAAHDLLERYFAEPSSRPGVVKMLQQLPLPPDDIVRLARVRRGWEELKPGVRQVESRVGPLAVNYLLGVPPGYTGARAWPLVIRLPPPNAYLGERPADPAERIAVYRATAESELQSHPDALVLVPILDRDLLVGPSYLGMNQVIQPMLHVAELANIDPARVYLVGHSVSAVLAWNLVLHHPSYFAGAQVLGGSAAAEWQRLRLPNLRNLRVVIWHDSTDKIVPVAQARALVGILRRLKYDVEYTETRNGGHVPDARVVQSGYESMRQARRELYPRTITLQSNRHEVQFNRIDWVQVNQPARPGDESRMIVARGRETVVLFSSPMRLEARLTGDNVIDVRAENVDSFRLFLNAGMVDLARPVLVRLNGRVVSERQLNADLSVALRDQLQFGRGWRVFTVAIDVPE